MWQDVSLNFFLNSHKIDLKLNILNINKIYSRIKCKECQSDVMNILNSDGAFTENAKLDGVDPLCGKS